jgi:hypothetical protein
VKWLWNCVGDSKYSFSSSLNFTHTFLLFELLFYFILNWSPLNVVTLFWERKLYIKVWSLIENRYINHTSSIVIWGTPLACTSPSSVTSMIFSLLSKNEKRCITSLYRYFWRQHLTANKMRSHVFILLYHSSAQQ